MHSSKPWSQHARIASEEWSMDSTSSQRPPLSPKTPCKRFTSSPIQSVGSSTVSTRFHSHIPRPKRLSRENCLQSGTTRINSKDSHRQRLQNPFRKRRNSFRNSRLKSQPKNGSKFSSTSWISMKAQKSSNTQTGKHKATSSSKPSLMKTILTLTSAMLITSKSSPPAGQLEMQSFPISGSLACPHPPKLLRCSVQNKSHSWTQGIHYSNRLHPLQMFRLQQTRSQLSLLLKSSLLPLLRGRRPPPPQICSL